MTLHTRRQSRKVKVLAINAGSSSLKTSLHQLPAGSMEWDGSKPQPPLWEASVEWLQPPAVSTVRVTSRSVAGGPVYESASSVTLASPVANLADLLALMWRGESAVISGPDAIDAIGHRVVFAGADHRKSERLTPAVCKAIARASEYAPSHDSLELVAIDAALGVFGADLMQVAIYDSAFHTTISPAAYTYAIPYRWLQHGIRRYGYHGISHKYAAARATRILDREPESLRVVTCHLGSGCSIAAVNRGHSVDTTMGFTPLDGVVMATRSGAIDPGIAIHLLRHQGYTADTLDAMLNRESGLLGLSGISGDMRLVLTARDAGDERAAAAIQVYVRSVRHAIAAMATSMGGLDTLVFTAGVGEHASAIRAEICEALGFIGVSLDADANSKPNDDAAISLNETVTPVVVVHAQENWAIAMETAGITRTLA
jgi:acetate kinase